MNSDRTPRVSVVMPVYNGERFIREAINSILAQTYQDFEFIIVDDGSTDSTGEVISSYQDPRIIFFRFVDNRGFIQALKHGIINAKSEWIARMDADDISYPERLSVQMDFLNAHPECVFVGSVYNIISPAGKFLKNGNVSEKGWRYITKETITLSQQSFADPSVIFHRQSALNVGLYDEDLKYEIPLWYKLLTEGKGVELKEPLLLYRVVLNSLSNKSVRESTRLVSKTARLRYDPENAHRHSSWEEVTWPSTKAIRISKIIRAIRLCNDTGDNFTALRIFIHSIPEFSFDSAILKIFLKGVMNIESFRPFRLKSASEMKEITFDWMNEIRSRIR